MKKEGAWIAAIFIGIAILLVAFYFFTPESKKEALVTEPIVQPTETVETSSLPDGWKKYDSNDFIITAPETWFISYQKNLAEKNEIIGIASTDSETIYANLNEINISVSRFPKTEKSFNEVITEKIKDQNTAATAVDFMKTVTNSLFNEITIDDIRTSKEEITLNNGTVIIKNTFQCLKPCDIESGAHTLTQYFIETEKETIIFSCLTGIDEKSDTLNLIAEQIIKTIEIK